MQPFSEPVQKFLEDNIQSVDQLEILRLLAADRGSDFTLNSLARKAQTSARSVSRQLEALERSGLIEYRPETRLCRYLPRSTQLDQSVASVLEAYNERPVTMIRYLANRVQGQPS